MTHEEIRAKIITYLRDIAPEADWKAVDPTKRLRDQVEIDSVDFLGFITRIYNDLGINVPESDYGELDTLDHIVAYLEGGRHV